MARVAHLKLPLQGRLLDAGGCAVVGVPGRLQNLLSCSFYMDMPCLADLGQSRKHATMGQDMALPGHQLCQIIRPWWPYESNDATGVPCNRWQSLLVGNRTCCQRGDMQGKAEMLLVGHRACTARLYCNLTHSSSQW